MQFLTDRLLNGMNPEADRSGESDGRTAVDHGWCRLRKTRVLTHRIAYLMVEKGVNPYNILAITFTNKAAQGNAGQDIQDPGRRSGRNLDFDVPLNVCADLEQGHRSDSASTETSRFLIRLISNRSSKSILKDKNIDPKKFDPRCDAGIHLFS